MKIAVVGAYGVGMTFALSHSPERGETVRADSLSVSHGGKGSNQAVAAARLGASVTLLTCVGRDDAAASARRMWAEEGVSAVAIEVDEPTLTGAILVEPGGDNRIVIALGAAASLSVDDVEAFADEIDAADICLVSLEIPLPVAIRALEVARRVGTRTVLNPAPAPARALSDRELGLVDLLTPNAGEARALAGTDAATGFGDAIDVLAGRFSGTLIVTMGADGACIAEGESRTNVAAYRPPQVLDTTGAGDAFNSALAVSLVQGQSLEEAVLTANAAAAHCVSVRDVLPSLATQSDVDQILRTDTRKGPTVTEGIKAH